MKAAILTETGLQIRDAQVPQPDAKEVLVRVKASGLNRIDLAMASGKKHGAIGGAGAIAGLEWSGDVIEVGVDVDEFKPGDRVMCSGKGGYAEFAVSDMGRTVPIPNEDMSYEQAATLPIALQTMHNALVTQGRLKKGETVIIQGASSGVGIMGVQIAKMMDARLVIGTSTNAERRTRLSDLGADLVLDSSDPDWAEVALEATGGTGVDLIVDMISAGVANQNMKAVRVLGRIVNVGRLGGFIGKFDFDLHAAKRIDYIGVTFRTRSVNEIREINRLMRADLWNAVQAGQLQVPIDRIFTLDEALDAQAYMATNTHFGKIVLRV